MGAGTSSDETRPGGPPLRRETSRLLSFSDGVFAIIITLLVLDLQPPRVGRGQMLHALVEQWPAYLAYVTSYVYVAVNWLNHRAAFNRVANSGKALQWYNLEVLFSTALLPFATSVVSQAMREGDQADQRTGVVVYGLVGVLVSVSWLGLYHYLARHHDLLDQTVPRRFFPAERARAAGRPPGVRAGGPGRIPDQPADRAGDLPAVAGVLQPDQQRPVRTSAPATPAADRTGAVGVTPSRGGG